jgi:DICT domain-containing protein/signal transduction histidine kinase
MRISTSVLEALLQTLPHLRPQMYFKSSLTALSHAMEDQVLAGSEHPLVIASFQRERFYRQEANRYQRISELTEQVYVLAAPETDFTNRSEHYETIAFDPQDGLAAEWHLVVIGQKYAACLICQERKGGGTEPESVESPRPIAEMDQARRFDGVWTFDRQVSYQAASILLDRIARYRPELAQKIAQAKSDYLKADPSQLRDVDPDPFAQRLVTYLQAGQYKLLKAYRSISAQERRERLVNSITAAIRRSLDPEEIFKIAVQEMGQALKTCRCVVYRCRESDQTTQIHHEFLNATISSLAGQTWPLQENPLFRQVLETYEPIAIEDTQTPGLAYAESLTALQALIERWQIQSWLMVPILYKGRLLGMVELHHCQPLPYPWTKDEITLVEAIATQLGVALIQAESYANLEDLNQQLEALERTRSNLIAITGHELRTPLSTIQVCLESLATEPDMSPELRQVMLNSALADADRMRKLVQDFLTLSRLESGRIEWNLEPLSLQECIDLALSSVRARFKNGEIPVIAVDVPKNLPLIRADGEWLVEVLTKLIDNACKFTGPDGKITIAARPNGGHMLEITVADTGRGIEPQRLDVVFDRFYQEEGALRRTTGGTGLGLAICRQIVQGLGGEIWAESPGRDQGSQFHFTIPIVDEGRSQSGRRGSRASSRKR